VATIDGMN